MPCLQSFRWIVHGGNGVGQIIFRVPGQADKKLFSVHHFFLMVLDLYKVFPVVSDILISAKKRGKKEVAGTFLRKSNSVDV